MADIFISYKREDRERVRGLVRALQERGFTVWWDNRLEWGDNWMRCIKRALDAAACVVVVWTPKSVTSDGNYRSEVVAAEAEEARRRGVLLPVRMGDVTRPFPHGNLQEEDLSNWLDNADDADFIRVAARLETLCGARSLPKADEITAWLRAEDANNAGAFREFARAFPTSRYASEAEPRAAECDVRSADVALARDAAKGIVERVVREIRKPDLTPPIGLRKVTKEINPFSRSELFESLKGGAKGVLQAAPGGGKSTALLDLALAYSNFDAESIGVYLRLKDLFNQNDDMLTHLERLETDRLISESAWRELARSGCLSVFCDGWNELSAGEREKVGSALDLFALSYPQARLMVGTRPLAPPPLRGEHLLITLQPLTREQIREIVKDRVGANAEAALAELRRSPSLLELVRNPFFLTAFCATRSAGSQATTREGLIAGMLEAMAAKPEHAKPLRDVLGLHHERYLVALAVEMLREETAELSSDQARIVVNRVSSELVSAGIENEPIKADLVLGTLRDHHCLIERGSSKLSYQFQHQLINEWYGAQEVRRIAGLALRDDAALGALDQLINRRAWTEALLFAAERPEGEKGEDATAHMILRAVGIDPDLAGEMIAVAPDAVWKKIAPSIKKFVDDWLPVSKARTLRFIMKCGKGNFADALWDAIREERDHHAAQALQDHNFDHPQVLGPYWRAQTADLDPRGRRSVLSMLASNSGSEGARMALEGALASREAETEVEVADTLSFYRFDEQLAELLAGMTDEGWELLVQRNHIDDLWSPPWREKAAAAAQRALQKMEAGVARLSFALLLKEKGEPVEIDLVSELLSLKFESGSDGHGLHEKVAALEPERLSDALLTQILEGRLLLYGASRFLRPTSAVNQERLLEICRAGGRRREIEFLAPLLDANSARQLLAQHLDMEVRYRALDGQARKALEGEREVLSSALYHADWNVLAAVILGHEPASSNEIGRMADLMMRAFGHRFGRDRRTPLNPDLRAQIVVLLEKWAARVVADAGSSRHDLHALAEAIGTFPDARLLTPLRSLIQAELELWRKEKAEFKAARERGTILHNSGARLSYGHRYGQNMLSLATGSNPDFVSNDDEDEKLVPSKDLVDAVIEAMSGFLADPEFGCEAARVLAVLRLDPIWSIGKKTFGHFDVGLVEKRRTARRERGPQPTDPVAGHILDTLPALLSDGSDGAIQQAMRLALSAARMECGERFEEVRRCVMERGSIGDVSEFLKLCLQLGHEVDGAAAVRCLDGLDARRSDDKWKWEYGERWFQWDELLELMIFGGKPMEAAERLLTYDTNTKDYSLRRILGALGASGHADALRAMILIKEHCTRYHAAGEWARALAALGSPEAGEALLSFLLKDTTRRGSHGDRDFARAVAGITEEAPSLRGRMLELARSGDARTLKVVGDVVRHIRTEEFMREIVALPAPTVVQLGGAISDALREICIEDRPVEGFSQAYDRAPRAIPALRAELFARVVANDEAAATCARLLLVVDQWRAGYGDPADEARHPNLALGKPWPPLAQHAWDVAAQLRRQGAVNSQPARHKVRKRP